MRSQFLRQPCQLLTVLAVAALHGLAQAAENTTEADELFYKNAPAPAPGACPYGTRNATLNPEVTQGPYYLDELLFRTNITEGQLGLPFEARITVLDTDCNPIVGAFVDVWHCNATGTYSGYTSESPGGTLAPAAARKLLQAGNGATDNTTFLRGTVQTDSNGVAVIRTIVPGWYSGRVTHMHTMIHITDDAGGSETDEYEDSRSAHTGQFFFEEALLDSVYQLYPYSRHTGDRVALLDDGIFASGGSDDTQLFTINYVTPGDLAAGLIGSVTAVIDPTANNTVGFTMGGGMGGAPGMGGPGGFVPGPGMAIGPIPAGLGAGFGGGGLPQATGRRLLRQP